MKKTIEVDLLKGIEYGCETLANKGCLGPDCGYIVLGTGTATIDMIDEKDAALAEVDLLQKAKQALMAKNELAIEAIDDKIQKLLAIGHEAQS